jgi:hypothetical protein
LSGLSGPSATETTPVLSRSARANKVCQDLAIIEGLGQVHHETANQIERYYKRANDPTADIYDLEQDVAELERAQTRKREQDHHKWMIRSGDVTSAVTAVLRNAEKKLPASNPPFSLLNGVSITETCCMLDNQLKMQQAWDQGDSTSATTKPHTPALDRLRKLCAITKLDFNESIEILELNRARNSIAHVDYPQLKLSGSKSDADKFIIACQQSIENETQLRTDGLVSEKDLESFRNIMNEWERYSISQWKISREKAGKEL